MNAVLRPVAPLPARPMRAVDLDAVMPIEASAYSHPWTRGNFIDSLAAGYRALLHCGGQGHVLGYYVALPGFEETHLLNLTVAPAHQGQGLGSAMLAELADWARARGDAALWLEVRPSNGRARALYLRTGFVEVGLRRQYYPADQGQREDAVVMRLDLKPPTQEGRHALV